MAPPKAFVQKLREFLRYQTEELCNSEDHIRTIERENLKMYEMLVEAGMETHPQRIGRVEIFHLRDSIPLRASDGNSRNRDHKMDLLYGFLRWCGRTDLPRLEKNTVKVSVDWLPEDVLEIIRWALENDPELALMFHLAADYGFRRVELIRAEPQDLIGPDILVRGKGKGPMGFKPRWLKRHHDTDHYLGQYLVHRDRIVRQARTRYPHLEEPRGLFVYYHRYQKRLGTYKENAMDRRMGRIRTLSGVKDIQGWHTLRRSCAQAWWRAETPIETISSLLGHEDQKTTIRYLGISYDDHNEAYNRRAQRQQQIRAALRAKSLTTPISTPIE